jgi:hypothetical protein
MNTTYIVTTQGLENYGAHAESGKFSDNNHYWKFKSGTEYMVTGLDREQDAMAFVMAIGAENGIGWKEYPCDIQTNEDWMKQWDMSDENDKEYYEFKMKHMVKVDPNTYKKEATYDY